MKFLVFLLASIFSFGAMAATSEQELIESLGSNKNFIEIGSTKKTKVELNPTFISKPAEFVNHDDDIRLATVKYSSKVNTEKYKKGQMIFDFELINCDTKSVLSFAYAEFLPTGDFLYFDKVENPVWQITEARTLQRHIVDIVCSL